MYTQLTRSERRMLGKSKQENQLDDIKTKYVKKKKYKKFGKKLCKLSDYLSMLRLLVSFFFSFSNMAFSIGSDHIMNGYIMAVTTF